VFVENGGHGGSAAAPLARQILARRFGKTVEPEPRKDLQADRAPSGGFAPAAGRVRGGESRR
jgi:hypothetical protein